MAKGTSHELQAPFDDQQWNEMKFNQLYESICERFWRFPEGSQSSQWSSPKKPYCSLNDQFRSLGWRVNKYGIESMSKQTTTNLICQQQAPKPTTGSSRTLNICPYVTNLSHSPKSRSTLQVTVYRGLQTWQWDWCEPPCVSTSKRSWASIVD
jgi:hypothetical protein